MAEWIAHAVARRAKSVESDSSGMIARVIQLPVPRSDGMGREEIRAPSSLNMART